MRCALLILQCHEPGPTSKASHLPAERNEIQAQSYCQSGRIIFSVHGVAHERKIWCLDSRRDAFGVPKKSILTPMEWCEQDAQHSREDENLQALG